MTSFCLLLVLAMCLACQVARCQVSRVRDREMSPLALATSLTRDRDTARDLGGRELSLATSMARHRDIGWEDREDTPYEVGVFCIRSRTRRGIYGQIYIGPCIPS